MDKVGSKITTIVFSAWRELLKFEGTGLSITLGQTLGEDDRGYFPQIQVREGDNTYFTRERSLGFRWFFSFLLFTHFRSYRDPQRRTGIFLLDEPASNLHQTAQSRILTAFEEFPNDQDVVYATHSHHMINPKWLGATFVVKNEAKEYSDLDIAYNAQMTDIAAERYHSFTAKHPKDKDYYRPILDALDYQPSELEYVPDLPMVEGKHDFYTLRFIDEMHSLESKSASHILPGTGKDKIVGAIQLYLGWGKNFVVLLDADRGGLRTHRKLQKEFGSLIDNRIFTFKDINSDWSDFSMEDVFVKTDRVKVVRSLYPEESSYDKAKFNAAIEDAYINSRKIKLHTNTVRRFVKVFRFLDVKLEENDRG